MPAGPVHRAVLATAAALALLPASTAGAQVAAPSDALVLGDSLAVGLRPALDELLAPDAVTWEARSGRTTPQGLGRLRARLRTLTPFVVVVSLGTNDGSDPARFTDRIGRVMAALPADACVVWPDLYRPSRKGPYAPLNAALRAAARRDPRLHVVGWLAAVKQGRVRLPDGLHPDAAGFATRSRMIAAAVRRHCR